MPDPVRRRAGPALIAGLALAALASLAVPALAVRHFTLADADRAALPGADSSFAIFENARIGNADLLLSGLF